ncbi:hypothetical protein [Burkholderia sp. Bp9131]|uniref:hypothetical protein n=1 Tax=Burkholderia sp. Bp9131 TaxID=2184571 RepID=UPI000F57415A|nr:hypothetical protein [Burkholderia sp. Bp9131]
MFRMESVRLDVLDRSNEGAPAIGAGGGGLFGAKMNESMVIDRKKPDSCVNYRCGQSSRTSATSHIKRATARIVQLVACTLLAIGAPTVNVGA